MTSAIDTGIGGVQVVFRDLVHWLERSGRGVHLVYQRALPSVRSVERTNPWGHPAVYCPMPGLIRDSVLLGIPVILVYLPITLFHLARLIRQRQIDVVNCQFLAGHFVHIVIAARLLRVPVVLSVHGADVDHYATCGTAERLLLRLVVRGASRIVACSEAMARQTTEAMPSAHRKITFVHNGLDLSRYQAARAARPVPGQYILCVSRHVRKKGVDTLLRAFVEILRAEPDLFLVLVGDGPLLEEHRTLARVLGIDRHVVFAGTVPHDEIAAFFAGCALFVLPSRAEPFGVVLLEAAYHRKAVVATRVGGIPEIITDGVNGVLIQPDDPAGMAAEIVGLLRDGTRADRLGEQAHRTLVTRFLWKDRIHDHIAVYEGGA